MVPPLPPLLDTVFFYWEIFLFSAALGLIITKIPIIFNKISCFKDPLLYAALLIQLPLAFKLLFFVEKMKLKTMTMSQKHLANIFVYTFKQCLLYS
jgi:hypothetical protein